MPSSVAAMAEIAAASEGELPELALSKMSNVLGDERAKELYQRIMSESGLALRSADELFAFGRELAKLGGFEAAVGAMLQVSAVMRGARGG